MNEAQLQDAAMDLGHLSGWWMHHARPARTSSGWRTPISGHAGFPDLVFAHPLHGLELVEFKSAKGRLSEPQVHWATVLRQAARRRTRYHLWRPEHWDDGTIERTLMEGA